MFNVLTKQQIGDCEMLATNTVILGKGVRTLLIKSDEEYAKYEIINEIHSNVYLLRDPRTREFLIYYALTKDFIQKPN